MSYYLIRPGISVAGTDEHIFVPSYPFHYEKPKIGDTVWVIVCDGEDLAIDRDTISDISNYYESRVNDYHYRKSVIEGREPWPEYESKKVEFELGECPDPSKKSDHLIDFWLNKYHNGHGNCFGETIYSSFEEARSVLVQFFHSSHEDWNRVLHMSEDELKPKETES